MRASASWNIGCSRITELPSRERDEDIVQGRVMGGERSQLETAALQLRQQGWQRAVQLGHSQRQASPPASVPAPARTALTPVIPRNASIRPSGTASLSANSTTCSAPSVAINSRGVPSAITV